MRRNLRSLKTTVKANLIKSNDFDFASLDKAKSAPGSTEDKTPNLHTHRRGRSEVAMANLGDDPKGMTKRTRARSKTFTWGKNSSSPAKKQKPDTAGEAPASGLVGLKSPSVVSLGKSNRASRLLEGMKTAKPEDYVSYLRTEQQPEKVQVGKVHKLRQLLRNETVGWVETFIKLGGMTEIVGLLHRIMKVDWR
jgi:Diaphanous GTPase-binding Domain